MANKDLVNLILNNRLESIQSNITTSKHVKIYGKVIRIVGLTIEAIGINAPVGALCLIKQEGQSDSYAEVIGFSSEITYLMSYSSIDGIKPKALVEVITEHVKIGVTNDLMGRMIDGNGKPLDDLPPLSYDHFYDLHPEAINPIKRKRIDRALDVGVRAINGLMTICSGQRIGIFAESGIGKSMLLGMMTKFTEADVVVVGLIGERGREVKEFIEEVIGPEALHKCVVVASPADTSPLLKISASMRAMSIAEYYRDQNKNVLLIIDSMTRYANALREVGLACGELPTAHGYPPSVFNNISEYIERAGNSDKTQGSITGIFTVLIEKDELADIVGDHVKSILDGHIVLSRKLADMGHYPAIDIEKSVSRVMQNVVPKQQFKDAVVMKKLYSLYQQNKELLSIGMYKNGSNLELDKAFELWPVIQQYLQQDFTACIDMPRAVDEMRQISSHATGEVNDQQQSG